MTDKKSEIPLLKQDPDGRSVPAVAKLAHEVKNPLNAIIGYTQMIQAADGQTVDLEQVKAWAEVIHKGAVGLVKTCERVLDEETNAGIIVKKEDIDFRDFGRSIVTLFQSQAKSKGVTLSLKVSDKFPILHTDPVLLAEMLNNLIKNAIKFTPAGGRVEVLGEVDEKQDALILVVQDTGKGIPMDVLFALRRGERVAPSTDRAVPKGWGLGLRITMENARRIGCEFDLHSPENKGTIAYMRFFRKLSPS